MSILEIPSEQYHLDDVADQPTLSASIARILVSKTPAHAHAQHPRLNPDYKRDEDPKYDVGNVCHALLLEGTDVVEVIPADDWRTVAAREARDHARQYGRVPLLTTQWEEVQTMLATLRAQLGLLEADPPVFTDGKPEQTLVWDEDGVKCRARLDWLRDDYSAADDLKTTAKSGDPRRWGQHTLFGMGYDVQAAFYRRGVKAVTGVEPEFRFVVCEVAPPFLCSVLALDHDAWEIAESKVDYALTVWRRCLETGRWDGYERRVAYASTPGWAAAAWMEREAEVAA